MRSGCCVQLMRTYFKRDSWGWELPTWRRWGCWKSGRVRTTGLRGESLIQIKHNHLRVEARKIALNIFRDSETSDSGGSVAFFLGPMKLSWAGRHLWLIWAETFHSISRQAGILSGKEIDLWPFVLPLPTSKLLRKGFLSQTVGLCLRVSMRGHNLIFPVCHGRPTKLSYL
jgi:hypothetical protein